MARANRRGGAQKGQGTVSEGVQKLVKMSPSGGNCEYPQLYPLLKCLHIPTLSCLRATRRMKEETEVDKSQGKENMEEGGRETRTEKEGRR